MIVRIQKGGKSFKWLGQYLTHDAGKAQTTDRVAWTETLNLAHQHVQSAIDEMYWTYRAADQLKRAAGIATGGTPLKSPVKHVSLNWHPDDPPTKDEMIEAVRGFMHYMGWQDHQAVLVAHNDRPHQHVHVMMNTVSPIDGRGLSAGYEWNRAERWRENYDRVRFRNRCEQDLKPYAEREKAPTREAWLKFKEAEKTFDKAEADRATRAPDYFERHEPVQWKAKEWKALHGYQKDQRKAFFAGGKKAFRDARNAVFREVRSEFRKEWSGYFQLRKEGFDPALLGEIKKGILERQNAELEKRRDAACKELRGQRDTEYAGILRQQRQQRAELRSRQQDGLRSFGLLDKAAQPEQATASRDRPIADEFRKAARNVGDKRSPKQEEVRKLRVPKRKPRRDHHKVREPFGAAAGMGLGALGALGTIGERLFDGFFGGPMHKPRAPKPDVRQRASNENATDARATEQKLRTEELEADEATRLYEAWQERRRTRGHRDRD